MAISALISKMLEYNDNVRLHFVSNTIDDMTIE